MSGISQFQENSLLAQLKAAVTGAPWGQHGGAADFPSSFPTCTSAPISLSGFPCGSCHPASPLPDRRLLPPSQAPGSNSTWALLAQT